MTEWAGPFVAAVIGGVTLLLTFAELRSARKEAQGATNTARETAVAASAEKAEKATVDMLKARIDDQQLTIGNLQVRVEACEAARHDLARENQQLLKENLELMRTLVKSANA